MKINFTGKIDHLKKGIELLKKDLNYEIGKGDLDLEVINRPGKLKVKVENKKARIEYQEKIHFFRGLGLLLEKIEEKNIFKIKEEPQFKMNGIMVDVSRNSVMKAEAIKKMLRIMAVMGLNMMMLYTEDTYEVEDYPYFGYMRGRYSQKELKEFDDYADELGIEMIPCIQTLAHLHQAIKWNYAKDIKDTNDILLVGEEKTYDLIEKMIESATAPFRSNRIHIGMDEAHQIGRGKYLDINGYHRRFDIINDHLKKVKDIALEQDLDPMIWSDMYFRLGSKNGDYYDLDADIPQDVIDDIPEEVQLVYWDYYHNQSEFYSDFIQKHKSFGKLPVFAGGIWTWAGIAPNLNKSIVTTNAALSACKKEGVEEVFATMWGDNGGEVNIFSALIGLQLYAEHGYHQEIDMERVKERFEFCTGGSYESFMNPGRLDTPPGIEKENVTVESNPSKYLLWQDPLIGLFDKHIKDMDISNYYQSLAEELKEDYNNHDKWSFVFDVPYKIARVLSIKAEIGIRLKAKYDNDDKKGLKNILEEIPKLYQDIKELREAHRKQWLATYKVFGWEVIDLRYGGLLARIDTAKNRLEDYLAGEIEKIEELEEERLFFDGPERPEGVKLGRFNKYHRMVTASAMGFNS